MLLTDRLRDIQKDRQTNKCYQSKETTHQFLLIMPPTAGACTEIVFRGGPGVDFEVNVAKFKKYLKKKCIYIFKKKKFRGGGGPAVPPPKKKKKKKKKNMPLHCTQVFYGYSNIACNVNPLYYDMYY